MIVAPIGVTGARENVIDFSSAFFYDDTAVILKMPDPNESKWRTYIDIFRQEVLMCIGVALLVGSVILYLLTKVERVMYGRQHKVFSSSFTGCVLYLYGAMLAQGGRNLPASAAGRAFLSGWWLFCIVVAGTFSGNLIAVLTVSKDKAPFDTLKDMAGQSEYKFGTLGNSMWTELFRVKEGGYAYIADKGLFSFWLATNCDLILLKEKFFPSKYAIGLPNNSVHTKIFSDQVGKIYESGLLQVWVKKWWPKQTFCSGSLVTQAQTLNLMDVQSSFYVLAVGLGLAGVVLTAETGYTITRQGLQSSAWFQNKMRSVRGRMGRLLSWGMCIETARGTNSTNSSGDSGRNTASRSPCDGKEAGEDGRGQCESNRHQVMRQYKRKWSDNNLKKGGRQDGDRNKTHKVSSKYEANVKDANQYVDIYYSRDGTGFQNEADRVFKPKYSYSDFTNISTLSGE
ncbi:glutamate receptor [Elysia marginata]|uniref:Glutamate receptor n=1 Tax=Elysia marginata TaxID=1093978 RepID=A0AAV4ITR4_9GAST|nr:glutamate receptor [Elysia marginata]